MTTQTITLTATNGDTYTATRDTKDEPWLISFPEGDSRFYGHVGEVKRRMQALMIRNGVERRVEAMTALRNGTQKPA